jgi:hypothetical protein
LETIRAEQQSHDDSQIATLIKVKATELYIAGHLSDASRNDGA